MPSFKYELAVKDRNLILQLKTKGLSKKSDSPF